MTYSVLTKVTSEMYNGEKFYLYKHGENGLVNMSKDEAEKLKTILDKYPNVFSETEIVPREDEEIKLLGETDDKGNLLGSSFDFENVQDECPEIIDHLEKFDSRITGIGRDETVRQTYSN
jgi:hypothetical protein